ncbi:MAG: phosphoribosylformylglycinamidine cyclo-ligase [Treponema sp.]|jgi:phosphoribosylformylglycinamidine cyclo-ligase|nr:phosphoribosylformylglycinamidine cyclo-ligase [Treponema sp.]
MNYREAGVNIEEGYRAVGKYRELAKATANAAVLNGIGSFAGMFSLKEYVNAGKGMEDPVLVSGADGVGTKLDIAFRMKTYRTVGVDCVAMCVNDILCHGAKPLFFLDYLACGKLDADVASELVEGVAMGCREAGCALLGGETAEMPGFYDEGKYDLAGFGVGVVDRKNIIDGGAVREGDALIGIAASGAHSNGFSLIRKVLPDLDEDFGGMNIGRALLEPTRIYVKPVLRLMERIDIRGMAHITGGGFYENIPRMFKADYDAVISTGSWTIPALFNRIAYGVSRDMRRVDANDSLKRGVAGGEAEAAGMEILRMDMEVRRVMFETFNMGIGFVLTTAQEDAAQAKVFLEENGFPAWEIGRVEKGSRQARFV